MGNLVAYPYDKMLTRSPEKVVYFPDEVDAIPEKVAESEIIFAFCLLLLTFLLSLQTNMKIMVERTHSGSPKVNSLLKVILLTPKVLKIILWI